MTTMIIAYPQCIAYMKNLLISHARSGQLGGGNGFFLYQKKITQPMMILVKGGLLTKKILMCCFWQAQLLERLNCTITIPAGKAVLFPVINFTTSYSEDPSLKTEDETILHAKSNIDDIVKKEANIDGASLLISEKHRVQSPPFDFSFPANNIYGVKDGSTRGVGDGYWILF